LLHLLQVLVAGVVFPVEVHRELTVSVLHRRRTEPVGVQALVRGLALDLVLQLQLLFCLLPLLLLLVVHLNGLLVGNLVVLLNLD
jgi:hypothetical protein